MTPQLARGQPGAPAPPRSVARAVVDADHLIAPPDFASSAKSSSSNARTLSTSLNSDDDEISAVHPPLGITRGRAHEHGCLLPAVLAIEGA